MKQTIFIILLVFTSSIIYAQTTKVATSTSSSAPVVYTVTGSEAAIKKQTDQLWTVIRLLQQQTKRDSINYVTDNAKLSSLIISTPKSLADSMAVSRKALKDSMATLLPVSTVTVTLDSLMKVYKADFDKQIKALQDAGKLTGAQVASIKLWMDKNFKF